MQEWVEQELETAGLGDERLAARFRVLTDCLSRRPSVSIPNACGGPAEMTAAYRFFGRQRMMDLTAAWEAFGLAARAARKRKKCV